MNKTNDTATAWHYTNHTGIEGIHQDGYIRANATCHSNQPGLPPPSEFDKLLDKPLVWFTTDDFSERSIKMGLVLILARDETSISNKAQLLYSALEATGGMFRVAYPAARLLPVLGLLQPAETTQPHRHGWRVTFNDVPLADCIGIDMLEIADDLSLSWRRIWAPTPEWFTVSPWPASVYTQFPSTKAQHHAASQH
jgi:hypothetical protein